VFGPYVAAPSSPPISEIKLVFSIPPRRPTPTIWTKRPNPPISMCRTDGC